MFYRAFLICCLLFLTFPAVAQPPVDAFHQTLQIGRGAILNAQWHPDGTKILVDTVAGGWLYTADNLFDLAHLENVRLARFSLDGQFIAGIDHANNVTLSHTDSLMQTDSFAGHSAYVIALEWSPDGTRLATLDRTGRLIVWDAPSGQQAFETHMNGADRIAWSVSGTYLAAMNRDNGAVSLWDKRGARVLTLNPSPYPFIYTADILWRNDTQLLRWVGEENAAVDVWDASTGAQIMQFSAGAALRMAYSPDGSKLAVASYRSQLQDAATGELLFAFQLLTSDSAVAWTPDGRQLAFGGAVNSAGEMTRITVVNAETNLVAYTVQNYFKRSIKGLYWSPDSTRLLIVDDANGMFLDSSQNIAHTDIGTTATWSPDSTLITAADTNYGSRLWNAVTGEVIAARMFIDQPASQLAWQPHGTLVATRSGDYWQSPDFNVYVWDSEGIELDASTLMVIPSAGIVADMAWSPDGSMLAVAERERYIRLWLPAQPNSIRSLDLCSENRYCGYSIDTIAWSPDGRMLSYSFFDSGNGGGVWLLDTSTGLSVGGGSPHYQSDWAWTPDNRLVWVRWGSYGDPGPSPTFYDLQVGLGYAHDIESGDYWTPTTVLPGSSHRIDHALLSPDGNKVIAFDMTDNALIWQLQPQTLRAQLYGVQDAVWSPDSSLLITYGADGVLRVVDALSGAVLHTFDDHLNPSRFDWQNRIQVIWSSDSRKIALLDRGVLFIYEHV